MFLSYPCIYLAVRGGLLFLHQTVLKKIAYWAREVAQLAERLPNTEDSQPGTVAHTVQPQHLGGAGRQSGIQDVICYIENLKPGSAT